MSDAILVTGATGKQGGATARALLTHGLAVRALVRDRDAAAARALGERGALLVEGDLDDPDSLEAAVEGARGVFSIQAMDPADPTSERRHAENLMRAARGAGIEQIVHTSVAAVAGGSTDPERVGPSMAAYHASKAAAEHAARDAASRHLTILRPGVFMENVLTPSMYFPHGDGRMLVAVDLDVPVAWVGVADVGRVAAAAFADPARFDGVELELAADLQSFRAVGTIISAMTGRAVTYPATPAEATAQGLPEALARAQRLMTSDPSVAHPRFAQELGLRLTSFEEWARSALAPA